jgi:hypothetical protein
MDKLHKRAYTGHPSYQKMITATRKLFYCPGLKKEIADYLSKCIEFQHIKTDHRHLAGLLHPLSIPEWKWKTISMDAITGLPKSTKQNDAIMVVVEKLHKKILSLFSLKKYLGYMEFLRRSSLIEIQNLRQYFGNICLLVLKPNCCLVQPITLKLMEKWRE